MALFGLNKLWWSKPNSFASMLILTKSINSKCLRNNHIERWEKAVTIIVAQHSPKIESMNNGIVCTGKAMAV